MAWGGRVRENSCQNQYRPSRIDGIQEFDITHMDGTNTFGGKGKESV